MKSFFWTITFTFLGTLSSNLSGNEVPIFQLDQGVIDLSNWNPQHDRPVTFKGRWKFLWKSEPSSNIANNQQSFIPIPGGWGWSDEKFTGEPKPSNGWGIYSIQILGLRGKSALRFSGISSAFQVGIYRDSQVNILGSVGQFAKTLDGYTPA